MPIEMMQDYRIRCSRKGCVRERIVRAGSMFEAQQEFLKPEVVPAWDLVGIMSPPTHFPPRENPPWVINLHGTFCCDDHASPIDEVFKNELP